jgi:hypothetical protein
LAFPAWLAVMEHVPAAMIVTVLPATVQTPVVVEVKVIARPELAVALALNGDTPRLTLRNPANAIVCAAGLTVKLCVTVAAGA